MNDKVMDDKYNPHLSSRHYTKAILEGIDLRSLGRVKSKQINIAIRRGFVMQLSCKHVREIVDRLLKD